MTGLPLLIRKEMLEQVRTMRLWVVMIVFALFAIVSPLTAKYLPDIVRALAGDQLNLASVLPTPSTPDAVDQFLKNLTQFGALAAILLAMGSVATEKDRGTAAFVLTKPASRAAFLVAKLVAISANLSPMPAFSADSHQLAMMIMAVLPETKLSRNGPVVLASDVPIAGSEEHLISVS